MSGYSINIVGVSKKFCRTLKHSMIYGLQDLYTRRQTNEEGILRANEFWALKNIDLNIGPGEVMGIIGSNGSGKSTLLKLMNGIYLPDTGMLEVSGRIGALIEVGAGFHPLLSGRENIYINGTILGMNREEIDKRFDEIVEFAEIGEFLDSPVKYYSSGMFVRLGFSIAIHSDPDILLVDEALAVGDISFRSKCFQEMNRLLESDRSVIFISHDINQIRRFCDRVIWLEKGRICMDGEVTEVTNAYVEKVNHDIINRRKEQSTRIRKTNEAIVITGVDVCDADGVDADKFDINSKVIFKINYRTNRAVSEPNFGIGIFTEQGVRVTNTCTAAQSCSPQEIDGTGTVICAYNSLPLMPGRYSVAVAVKDAKGLVTYDRQENASHFFISQGRSKKEESEEHGILYKLSTWSFNQ